MRCSMMGHPVEDAMQYYDEFQHKLVNKIGEDLF